MEFHFGNICNDVDQSYHESMLTQAVKPNGWMWQNNEFGWSAMIFIHLMSQHAKWISNWFEFRYFFCFVFLRGTWLAFFSQHFFPPDSVSDMRCQTQDSIPCYHTILFYSYLFIFWWKRSTFSFYGVIYSMIMQIDWMPLNQSKWRSIVYVETINSGGKIYLVLFAHIW